MKITGLTKSSKFMARNNDVLWGTAWLGPGGCCPEAGGFSLDIWTNTLTPSKQTGANKIHLMRHKCKKTKFKNESYTHCSYTSEWQKCFLSSTEMYCFISDLKFHWRWDCHHCWSCSRTDDKCPIQLWHIGFTTGLDNLFPRNPLNCDCAALLSTVAYCFTTFCLLMLKLQS